MRALPAVIGSLFTPVVERYLRQSCADLLADEVISVVADVLDAHEFVPHAQAAFVDAAAGASHAISRQMPRALLRHFVRWFMCLLLMIVRNFVARLIRASSCVGC